MKRWFFLFFVAFSFVLSQAKGQIISPQWERFVVGDNIRNEGKGYYLLKIDNSFQLQDIKSEKFKIYRKLDEESYIVQLVAGYTVAPEKYRIYPVNDQWKLLSNLDELSDEFLIKITSEEILSKLSTFNEIEVVRKSENIVYIRGQYKDVINRLLPINEVIYIGTEDTSPVKEARVLDLNLIPNQINLIHHRYPNLNGEGMTISIKDQLYNINDIDIIGRHFESGEESGTVTNHATEMATVIAGAGNSFVNGKGVAWAANISSSDFNPVEPDPSEYYKELDAWVQNHSYGTSIENFYGVLAESFDISVNENPQLLHVFSSGNQGTESNTGGTFDNTGYANLTGNFKMSKNGLVVGAVDTVGRPLPFSSRGPAYDGRIKPEVVAYSTAGTSSAAALVSGVAVLLQQAYRQQYGVIPPSALVKGLLIHTSKDVGREGIDFETGYGNVNAYDALDKLMSGSFFSGSLAANESFKYTVMVPPNTSRLTATLIWNDPAAAPNDEHSLVNDLDMEISLDEQNWLPWVLNTVPENISEPPSRGVDHLNNVEQITINNPLEGDYVLIIKAFDIPEGAQDFYVIYDVEEKNQFSWLSPTGSDNLPYDGETTSYFRWNSTYDNETGTLEYSINGGESWKLINANVDLQSGHYRWKAPDVYSEALVKMNVGNEAFISDTFTISRPLTLSLGFNCEDSVMVRWPAVNGSQNYKLYTLGDKFAEPFAISTDTFYVYQKSELEKPYVAVQPIFPESEMIRSYMYNIELQGVGCYLRSFLSQSVNDEGIYLNLNLGTNYGVHHIDIQRLNNGEFHTIGIISEVRDDNIFFDDDPHEGLNIYRAKISFENGQTSFTYEISDLYLEETPFVIYPNPVLKEEYLNILSKEYEGKQVNFTLFNQLGVQVRTIELISNLSYIPLDGLPVGLYFYELRIDQEVHKGKIIIQ